LRCSQGFVAPGEPHDSNDLAGTDGPDQGDTHLDLRTAQSSASLSRDNGDDILDTSVDQLVVSYST
jgi:hypothetical protein